MFTDYAMILGTWYYQDRPEACTIRFILSMCVLFRGKTGAVCGKRLIFLYTSPHEHVEYNVSWP